TVIQLQPLQSRLFALAIALLDQRLLLHLHAVELPEKSLEIAQVTHGYRLLRALLELLLIFIAVRRQLLALLSRLLQLVRGVGQLAGGAVLAHVRQFEQCQQSFGSFFCHCLTRLLPADPAAPRCRGPIPTPASPAAEIAAP